MSLIATLFTNSCADGALVPAGGGWGGGTEGDKEEPTVFSREFFMICTPGVVRLARRATHQSGRALLVPRCNPELSADRFRAAEALLEGSEAGGPGPRRLTRGCPAEAGHCWAARRLRPAG